MLGIPTKPTMKAMMEGIATQSSPYQSLIVGQKTERRARFKDVCHLMHNGDGFWFRGDHFHSYLIMIATGSNVSHCGLIHRFSNKVDDLRVVDIVEGSGGRDISLYHDIVKYPGQYYWAPVNWEAWPDFNGYEAVRYLRNLVDKPYGRKAVALQALTKVPFSREVMYFMRERVDHWMEGKAPFCSMAQKDATCQGGNDPVPGRSSWLCTPQDTFQSLHWIPDKVALYPDDWVFEEVII